jgi:hypothetical protein
VMLPAAVPAARDPARRRRRRLEHLAGPARISRSSASTTPCSRYFRGRVSSTSSRNSITSLSAPSRRAVRSPRRRS